jgi:alpha-methylacyl-CoA racemase
MLLSDLGADVIRIDRPGGTEYENPVLFRGRSTIVLDLKTVSGRDQALSIARKADVLVEGYRPGVMERLGLGPAALCGLNPRLIYGRITGWGQSGPLSSTAGHDINFIALTGALAALGSPNCPPPPPLNLIGDYGGGSLYLAFGILAGLWERERSGQGQVIDSAIVDGVTSMMAMFAGLTSSGDISLTREHSLLGGAAPFYRCYECADRRYVAVGALEPKFYRQFLDALGLSACVQHVQSDVTSWPKISSALEQKFRQRTRDQWCQQFEGTDCCLVPVLDLREAFHHRHARNREMYVGPIDTPQPAVTPRFSRTPGVLTERLSAAELLQRWDDGPC